MRTVLSRRFQRHSATYTYVAPLFCGLSYSIVKRGIGKTHRLWGIVVVVLMVRSHGRVRTLIGWAWHSSKIGELRGKFMFKDQLFNLLWFCCARWSSSTQSILALKPSSVFLCNLQSSPVRISWHDFVDGLEFLDVFGSDRVATLHGRGLAPDGLWCWVAVSLAIKAHTPSLQGSDVSGRTPPSWGHWKAHANEKSIQLF